MGVNMHPVTSSMIKAIGHDADTSELHVEFNNGKVYRYADCCPATFAKFKGAESIGKHFGQNIRGKMKLST